MTNKPNEGQKVTGEVDEKEFALVRRHFTDEEGREWRLLDNGYGTPSDIRLSLRLGINFPTEEVAISALPPKPVQDV